MRWIVIAVVCAACSGPRMFGSPSHLTTAEIEAIPTSFPTTLGETRLVQVRGALEQDNVVAGIGKLISKLLDLRQLHIPMSVRGCDHPGAFYDRKVPEIVVCYEFIARANELAKRERDTYGPQIRAMLVFATLHEIAHALIDQLSLRVEGNEEDLADYFAVLLMTSLDDGALAKRLVDAPSSFFFALEKSRTHAADDPHSSDVLRARLALCLLWSRYHDAEIGAQLGAAQDACDSFGPSIREEWNRLLAPYTRVESGKTF